jgi:hypothetical protein
MNIVIIGRSREGKTTLARFIAQEHSECVIAWDPRGAEVFETDKEHTIRSVDDLEVAIQQEDYRTGILVIRPTEIDFVPEFEAYCDYIKTRLRGYSFIVDEAGLDIQKAQAINPHLRMLIISHGTERATIIQTTHFQADLFRTSTGLVNEMYIFQQTRPADLQIIDDMFGDELVAVVKALPRRHCARVWLDRRDEGEPQWVVMDEPEMWYIEPVKPVKENA